VGHPQATWNLEMSTSNTQHQQNIICAQTIYSVNISQILTIINPTTSILLEHYSKSSVRNIGLNPTPTLAKSN